MLLDGQRTYRGQKWLLDWAATRPEFAGKFAGRLPGSSPPPLL
jgi:hypothetical protein